MRSRIGLGITISRLIFLPVICLSIFYIAGMVSATNRIATVDAKVGQLSGQILFEVDEMRKAQKSYVLMSDPVSLRKIKESSQRAMTQIEDGLILSTSERGRFTAMKELLKSYLVSVDEIAQAENPKEDAAAFKQFSGGVASYQKRIDMLLAVAKRSKTRSEVEQAIDEISGAANSFDRVMTEWIIGSDPSRSRMLADLQGKGDLLVRQARLINETGWRQVEQERARTEAIGHRAVLLIGTTSVLTFLLSFALTWYLPKRVMQPIREVTQALRKVASGNYDVFLQVPARDELGGLVNEFHNLVSHMRYRESSKTNGTLLAASKESREIPYTVF
jgi:Signal transduction histidine kinase, nitrate/nitrite-specific